MRGRDDDVSSHPFWVYRIRLKTPFSSRLQREELIGRSACSGMKARKPVKG